MSLLAEAFLQPPLYVSGTVMRLAEGGRTIHAYMSLYGYAVANLAGA